MDEEYSYEVRRGRLFDEDPEFNDTIMIVTDRVYHRIMNVDRGDHSLRWFLHDNEGQPSTSQIKDSRIKVQ